MEQMKEKLQALRYVDKITSEIEEKLDKMLGNKPQLAFDFVTFTPKKGRRDL